VVLYNSVVIIRMDSRDPRESTVSHDSVENIKATLTSPNHHTSPLLGVVSHARSFNKVNSNGNGNGNGARFGIPKDRRSQLLKHSQYITAPLFWYYFRENIVLFTLFILLVGFTVPWFTPNVDNVNGFFLSGSVVSIVGTGLVAISYYHVIPWRRHPSKLILMRTFTNLLFSVLIIVNVSKVGVDGSTSCDMLTFLNQFIILAGELWVFTIAVDLKRSITNPFSNYISNVNFYHAVVWIFSLVNAAALLSVKSCHKQSAEGFCWIDINEKSPAIHFRSCLWGFFLSWMIICYVVAVLVIYFSHRRLVVGLENTYRAREAVIFETFRVIFLFLLYAVIIVFLFTLDMWLNKAQGLREFLSFAIGCRGFYDMIVWFYLHDFQFMLEEEEGREHTIDNTEVEEEEAEKTLCQRAWGCLTWKRFRNNYRSRTRGSHAEKHNNANSLYSYRRSGRNSMQAPLLVNESLPSESIGSTIDGTRDTTSLSAFPGGHGHDDHANKMIVVTDLDLTPQLNKELRKEVVSSVTHGIITTIRNWAHRNQQLGMINSVNNSKHGSFSSVGSQSTIDRPSPRSRTASMDPAHHQYHQRAIDGDENSSPSDVNVCIDAAAESGDQFLNNSFGNNLASYTPTSSMRQSGHTSSRYGSGFHSMMYSMFGYGYHAPGDYGEDHSARLSSFMAGDGEYGPFGGAGVGAGGGPGAGGGAVAGVGGGLKHASSTASLLTQARIQQQHDQRKQSIPEDNRKARSDSVTPTSTRGRSPSKQVQGQGADSRNRAMSSPADNGTPAPTPAPAEVVFDLDDKHRFRDFRPATFQTLRYLANITDDWYINQLSQPAKEQLTEGASDAFLFYAGGLIVKTVTPREAKTLLSILNDYREHLKNNPDSLIVRFLGLHALTFYGKEFTFVVMRNIFPTSIIINERFDIKGSWVDRSADLPAPGKRKICRHCSALFTVGSSDRCPEIVGHHEANVVFKDNDLSKKIRLKPLEAFSVLEALNKDSDALCRMGIMDYSLLIGVRNATYDVDQLTNNYTPPSAAGASRTAVQGSSNITSNSISSTLTSRMMKGSISSTATGANAGNVGANGEETNVSTFPDIEAPVPVMSARTESDTDRSHDHAVTFISTNNNNNTNSNINEGDVIDNDYIAGFSARAVVAPSVYYFGVVDILQTWDVSKRAEHVGFYN
jgi:hypothetical protein